MLEPESHLLLLEKIPEERQEEAALFLSGCFSLPPASSRSIAASGPIVLLSGLDEARGQAILLELSGTLPNGVGLRLARESEITQTSRLHWPRPPRLYGRDLKEFSDEPASADLPCPICAGMLRVFRNGRKFGLAKAGPPIPADDAVAAGVAQASDKDPLFSGVKPLAGASADFPSVRALQAGDTGFWLEHGNLFSQPPEPLNGQKERGKAASQSKAGLSAYMKPGAFAVVLARTRENQAIKIVADIMGIGEDAARVKCQSLGLCVARGISLSEAQGLKARFNSVGVMSRITKPM